MKVKVVLFFVLFTVPLLLMANSFHIWAPESKRDYSWENELVEELRNSKYSSLIGRYQHTFDFTNIEHGDFIIWIERIESNDRNIFFGNITLYQYNETINELCYRSGLNYNYGISRKLEWIIDCKKDIISWISKYGF